MRERSGFNRFPYSIFNRGIIFYSHVYEELQLPVGHDIIILIRYSQV